MLYQQKAELQRAGKPDRYVFFFIDITLTYSVHAHSRSIQVVVKDVAFTTVT